jgi:hypothetical protein
MTTAVGIDATEGGLRLQRGIHSPHCSLSSFSAARGVRLTGGRQRQLDPHLRPDASLRYPQGLAHEGLSQWQAAVDCYTQSIDLGRSVGADEPYILNSRGNCFISLGYCLIPGTELMLREGLTSSLLPDPRPPHPHPGTTARRCVTSTTPRRSSPRSATSTAPCTPVSEAHSGEGS